ncbi:MAG: hypothetical protein M3552_22790 [Planctomycetota bacterium]|nr:hypothetical protein [Planctomycetaceae bacterium]MDQ3333435.1 hypothetical protein [Planctomycetota bacterium]
MNVSIFRRRVADAVESREALDTPELARLASEAGDVAFWRSQVRLDRAISAWKTPDRSITLRRPVLRRLGAAVSAAAIGFGAAWISRPAETVVPDMPPVTTMQVAALDVPVEPPSEIITRTELTPVAAPRPSQDTRLAQATLTAERLAYAFQPVGDQVSSVVRLLIDAVPGADVLAL